MPIAPGLNFAHYEVLSRLGSGSMGEVYRARDKRLERHVAIKALPAVFSNDPDRLSRFINEAKILASINHPNIGAIYGMEELPSGEKCLILELIEGMSLSEKLGLGRLSIEDALRLCAGIALALEAAHERGVIHRDLKPGNIMIDGREQIKVLDFGLARRLRQIPPASRISGIEETRELLRTIDVSTIEGTPGYMSPEQVRGDSQDQRIDIFAFGCILFECLAGRRAYEAGSALDTMAAALVSKPPFTALPADTPRSITELLARCLEKEAANRLDNIGVARKEIERARGTRFAAALEKSSIPNNLPQETSSFIGRGRELAECQGLISNSRLLTLTGIGGSGKTRLALRLARNLLGEYPDGVWIVNLAPISDPDRVALAVASAIDVKEEPGRSLADTLAEHLQNKHALIILDNCEHLAGACAVLGQMLLERCSTLKLLATSRERLGLKGEHLFTMQPLSLPPRKGKSDTEEIMASEAVKLFVDRAWAVNPRFELDAANAPMVAEICSRLDGIPLAIELAAIRIKMLTVDQIRDKIGDRFRLLTDRTNAVPTRHQTLMATIQWSYNHLSPDEQRLLRNLSVFSGGWTLSAAKSVAGDGSDEFAMLDALTRLADKSLIVVDRISGREARYTMLETVKQYALEMLRESNEESVARGRHFDYYLRLAQEVDRHRISPEWIQRRALIDDDLENLLLAHDWCGEAQDRGENGLKLAFYLRNYWLPRGYLRLGFRVSAESLDHPGAAERNLARGKVLLTAGVLCYFMGQYIEGGRYLEQSLEIVREKGETATLSTTLTGLALIALSQKQSAAALAYVNEAIQLARDKGDRASLSAALNMLGDVYRMEGKLEEATVAYEEAMELFFAINDIENGAIIMCNLGRVWINRGDLAASRRILERLLDIAPGIGSQHVFSGAMDVSSGLLLASGKWEPGIKLYAASNALLERSSLHRDISDEKFLEPLLSRARQTLPSSRFDELYEDGHKMEFESTTAQIKFWLGLRGH
jgi:predicted ATPase